VSACAFTDKFVQQSLEHFCKMRQFAAPEFLRRLVAKGVQGNMPSGLIVQKVVLRAGTLAALATGSDMIKISLADLAVGLLGAGVSIVLKERIKAIFTEAEVMSSAQILDQLEEEHDGIQVLNMQDNHAKQAVRRLADRMREILNGKMPECPVSLEQIPKERVRILKCCTCVIDVNSLDQCEGNRCPLCRAPITQMGAMEGEGEEAPEADEPKSKAEGKKPMPVQSKLNVIARPREDGCSKEAKRRKIEASNEMRDTDSEEEDDDDDREGPVEEGVDEVADAAAREAQATFDERIEQISGQRPYSVDGILHVMQAQCQLNPSSRVLLCFGFQNNQRGVVAQILQRIRDNIPGVNVTDIDACVRDYQKMDSAKQHFDDPVRFPAPQVFVINTTDTSSSVQGLDLHMTDLTIVADKCALHTQRQAAGRSLRMKKRLRSMKRGELFPAKRLIVAQIQGWGDA